MLHQTTCACRHWALCAPGSSCVRGVIHCFVRHLHHARLEITQQTVQRRRGLRARDDRHTRSENDQGPLILISSSSVAAVANASSNAHQFALCLQGCEGRPMAQPGAQRREQQQRPSIGSAVGACVCSTDSAHPRTSASASGHTL
jgi:hypothetical protein